VRGRKRGPRPNLGNGASAAKGEAEQAAAAADTACAQQRDGRYGFAGAGGRTSSGEGDMGCVARWTPVDGGCSRSYASLQQSSGVRRIGGSSRVGGFTSPEAAG
jgi:hypothetical protein